MSTIVCFILEITIIGIGYLWSQKHRSDVLVKDYGENDILIYFAEILDIISYSYPEVEVIHHYKRFVQVGYTKSDGYVDFKISLFGGQATVKFSAAKKDKYLHYEWNLRCPTCILLNDKLAFSREMEVLKGKNDNVFYDDNSIRKKYAILISLLSDIFVFSELIGGERNEMK